MAIKNNRNIIFRKSSKSGKIKSRSRSIIHNKNSKNKPKNVK